MKAIEMVIGGIVAVALVVAVLDRGAGANQVLMGAGQFTKLSFGTLLGK